MLLLRGSFILVLPSAASPSAAHSKTHFRHSKAFSSYWITTFHYNITKQFKTSFDRSIVCVIINFCLNYMQISFQKNTTRRPSASMDGAVTHPSRGAVPEQYKL